MQCGTCNGQLLQCGGCHKLLKKGSVLCTEDGMHYHNIGCLKKYLLGNVHYIKTRVFTGD